MAQAVPMLMAVSSLSPVSIHTWMPAARSAATASGTPFCSLSSIAVPPADDKVIRMDGAASVRIVAATLDMRAWSRHTKQEEVALHGRVQLGQLGVALLRGQHMR